MTALPQNYSSAAIPDQLNDTLQQVAHRQWKCNAIIAACKVLAVSLIAILLAALLLGTFQQMPTTLRVIFASIAWAIVAASLVRYLLPALQRPDLAHAAVRVERASPDLHERLSSTVELAAERNPVFRGSPGLIAHLFAQAKVDAARIEPMKVVSRNQVLRWAGLLAPVLITWITLIFTPSTSHTTLAGLYHVILPWQNTVPAMFDKVAVTPGDITLAQGDSLDITAHLSLDFSSANRHVNLVRKIDSALQLTDSMPAIAAHEYASHFDDVEQTFAYRVMSDNGDSRWFNAIVHPLPTINSIEIRCDYPAYTGMTASVVSSQDGTIHALVGTRVTLTVDPSSPVVSDKSQIVLDDGTTLPFKEVAGGVQAKFTVTRSCGYRIQLLNEFGLTNHGEKSRSIVAIPDEPPSVVIQAPEPHITVGVTDEVPVKYIATDDFSIVKIAALVQVDDQPVRTIPVVLKRPSGRTVAGPPIVISVAEVLKASGIKQAKTITYQLEAWDNRDPDPQSGLSHQQTMTIERGDSLHFQDRQDRRLGEQLNLAIQRAINQLTQEQQQIEPATQTDVNQPLQDWHKKQLDQAVDQLPQTDKQLAHAVEDAKDSPLQDVAKQVRQIEKDQLQPAADDAVKADLNADEGPARKEAADRAVAEITQAREALQKLQHDKAVANAEQQAAAARDLAEAAAKQKDAVDAMKPQDAQQQQLHRAARDQAQASEKLQQAMQQSEALRDPLAQKTAEQLQKLIRNVEDLQKHQEAAAKEIQNQQAAADARAKAADLARQQEALNRDIQKSAEQNKDAIEKAAANPPSTDQQKNIVKSLDQNDLKQAHDQMQQATAQLHQEALQLQKHANDELHPTPQEQAAADKDRDAEKDAIKQKQAADQAADDLKNAGAEPQANEHALAAAKKAAEQTAKQAEDLKPATDEAKQTADAAKTAAQAAEQAADDAAANPPDAQKHLDEAAADLKAAGQKLADAAKKNAIANQDARLDAQHKAAQAAAEQANRQADEQENIQKALDDPQTALAKTPDSTAAGQAAQPEKQLADETREAEQQADELQQQAKAAHNNDVAARATTAKNDLTRAQQHAAEAAHAQRQAQAAQEKAADGNNATDAKAAGEDAQQALAQASTHQQQARTDLAGAEDALRGLPPANTDAHQPADPGAQDPGAQDPGAKDPGVQNPPASSGEPGRQAAQAAQEAAQAQQEAEQTRNPAAAQQAANALTKAAHAMAEATPDAHPQTPGQTTSDNPPQEPAAATGRSADPKLGIAAAEAPVSVPASVQEIGISADQWANLPPLVKKDLMNAAQQSGPPAYRQMMKDYYAKIAKLQDSGDQ